MAALNELKLRLGVDSADRSKDAILTALLERAGEWAANFCRTEDVPEAIVVEMAAHDHALLGAEGVGSRSVSGLSESFEPDYPEHVMSALRRIRRIGVPS